MTTLVSGAAILFELLLLAAIIGGIFIILKNYVYNHPSPTLRHIEEQNRILLMRVNELEEKVDILMKTANVSSREEEEGKPEI